MINYKIIPGVCALLCLLSSLAYSQPTDPARHKIVMWKMRSPQERWWREKARKLWDQDLIIVERRKRTTPKTLRLASFESTDSGVRAFVFCEADLVAMSNFRIPSLYVALDAFSGVLTYLFAHELVHFYNLSDSESYEQNKDDIASLLSAFEANEVVCMAKEANGTLPGDGSGNSVLSSEQRKARMAILHQEAYADLKGLELVQSGDLGSYHAITHNFSNQHAHGHQRGLARKYLDYGELLLCWGLYQQKLEQQNKENALVDSDSILHETIDHYLNNRNQYKVAMQSLHFLRSFHKKRDKAWLGFVDQRIDLSKAGTLISLCPSICFAAEVAKRLSPLAANPATAGPAIYLSVLAVANWVAPGYFAGIPASLLSKAYNSSYVWDRDQFAKALDTDVTRVSRLANRLIKRDEKRKMQQEEERVLLTSKRETKLVRAWFEQFNPFA